MQPTSPTPPNPRGDFLGRPRKAVLPAAAILAITLLAYLPILSGRFFADDYAFVVDNPLVQESDGLRRCWLTRESPDYFPATTTMLWLERRLWGDQPEGYHIVNVLLQAACAVLLWRVLRRLRVPGAWLAGLLFAVHPVAAASAAWITEGKNTLSLLFALASLLAYLRFDEQAEIGKLGNWEIGRLSDRRMSESPNLPISQSPTYYLLSVVLFLLALLAKTSVVMLPPVLLLCAWWRRGKISRKDLWRSAPFFALSLALGLVTIWFQRQNAIQGWVVRPEEAASRAAAAGWILWFYFFKDLLPAGLCYIYPRWSVPGTAAAFLPAALGAAGMAFLWTRRKSWGRAPFFAAAYFLIVLLPILGFVSMLFMGLSLVADHLQYLALIGVIASGAGLLGRAIAAGGPKRRAALFAAAGCAAVLGLMTHERAALFADPESLWRANLAANPAEGVWNGWAVEELNMDHPAQAVVYFDRTIAMGAGFAVVYRNRARACVKLNRIPEALFDYDTAIRLQPKSAELFDSRGHARERAGLRKPALEDYSRAIELAPNEAQAYCDRAAALTAARRFTEAIGDYDKAIELKPDLATAYNNRAVAYYYLKDYDKALEDVKRCEAHGGRPDEAFLKALGQPAPGTE